MKTSMKSIVIHHLTTFTVFSPERLFSSDRICEARATTQRPYDSSIYTHECLRRIIGTVNLYSVTNNRRKLNFRHKCFLLFTNPLHEFSITHN